MKTVIRLSLKITGFDAVCRTYDNSAHDFMMREKSLDNKKTPCLKGFSSVPKTGLEPVRH